MMKIRNFKTGKFLLCVPIYLLPLTHALAISTFITLSNILLVVLLVINIEKLKFNYGNLISVTITTLVFFVLVASKMVLFTFDILDTTVLFVYLNFVLFLLYFHVSGFDFYYIAKHIYNMIICYYCLIIGNYVLSFTGLVDVFELIPRYSDLQIGNSSYVGARVRGLSQEPSHLGYFLNVCFTIAIISLDKLGKQKKMYAIFILHIASLLLVLSVSAIVSFVFALSIYLTLSLSRKKLLLLATIIVSVTLNLHIILQSTLWKFFLFKSRTFTEFSGDRSGTLKSLGSLVSEADLSKIIMPRTHSAFTSTMSSLTDLYLNYGLLFLLMMLCVFMVGPLMNKAMKFQSKLLLIYTIFSAAFLNNLLFTPLGALSLALLTWISKLTVLRQDSCRKSYSLYPP